MTTRKLVAFCPDVPPWRHVVVAIALAVLGGGCATRGPLHVYSTKGAADAPIYDRGDRAHSETPSFIREGETVTAFAYDPFTDHFFLLLKPENAMRVVDRPARAVKREFPVSLAAADVSDLAIKPKTGHVFFLDNAQRQVVQTTRLGKVVRSFPVAGLGGSLRGIAYDAAKDRLLVLHGAVSSNSPAIAVLDLEGQVQRDFDLARSVLGPIAFDPAARELYAPFADTATLGVFDEAGRLLRTEPTSGSFVDVGERSLIRVF